MILSLFHDHPAGATAQCLERFQNERVLERLRAIDARARRDGLAALDPADDSLIGLGMEIDSAGRVTKNGYGVFDLSWQAESHPEWPAVIEQEMRDIRARIREAHKAPLRYLIWAGMGGSIEDKNMYQAVGLLKRGVRFYALDSTDPAKLKYILEDIERRANAPLAKALCSTLVVAMAMGMTSYEPVLNLVKLAQLYERHKIDCRANFLYMTLPGSRLDQFAAPRGYRRVELQLDGENSTAGRQSGPLTRGSLYALALAGVDLRAWMAGAALRDGDVQTALRLAAFLHAQGVAGRDMVTLLLPKPWAGASLWTKQDFEESLGKREDIGIKILIPERPRLAHYHRPKDATQNRVFLAVRLKGMRDPHGEKATLLRRAGYPVAALTFDAAVPLSRYMQFMHYVVFGMAYLREMNFVTQPSVELYKSIAGDLYVKAGKAGGLEATAAWKALVDSPAQMSWGGAVTLYYGALAPPPAADAPRIYAAILKSLVAAGTAEYGELTFFGDTRYHPAGPALRKVLERAGEQLFHARLRMPVDVYEGPAMNHSYHEMILGHGKCFSTILMAAGCREDYHRAQFLATVMALRERGRPVVAMLLKDLSARTLAALEDFFKQAAK